MIARRYAPVARQFIVVHNSGTDRAAPGFSILTTARAPNSKWAPYQFSPGWHLNRRGQIEVG